MSFYSYNGKHTASPDNSSPGKVILRLSFFPLLFLYLELVFHIYMGMELTYIPVYFIFSISAGLILSGLTTVFKPLTNHILSKILAGLISLVYVVEMVCKQILQTYYPLSTLGTAAGNKLTDYIDVIIPTVVSDIPITLLLFLPFLLLLLFGSRFLGFQQLELRLSGIVLAVAVVFHVLGLCVIHAPWKGDLTPSLLYHMDTNIDDQVEQLGMLNMLRLDVKHLIVPAKNPTGDDFSDLDQLGGGEASSSSSAESSPSGSSSSSESGLPPEPVVDTSPNIMDVNLGALAESSPNEDVKWLANFFNSVTPTNKNEYTGMFKGYNVVLFVLEGFSGYVIDPELTPTLYKLANEGFVFNNFYTPLHFTSTSNGECQTLLGLYPKNGTPITMTRTGELGTNAYFSLAQQLKRQGYQTLGYHGNGNMYGRLASHTNLGYDWHQEGTGLVVEDGWPQRDSYVVDTTVSDYVNSETPFHVYYLTISGHMPYSNNRIVAPYRDVVRSLPYTEVTQNYIATAMEVDKAFESLIRHLDEAGQLDNTLIVATPDHIPYFDVATLEELAGKKFGSSEEVEKLNESHLDFDVYKSSLIMWSASMEEPVQVDKVCGQVDILPTISNLLGLEYDSRMLAGGDALSDREGLVIFSSRCWKSDRGFYNRFTQEFTPAPGVTMTEEEQNNYVSSMKKLVRYKLESTPKIVENDFYNIVFGQK